MEPKNNKMKSNTQFNLFLICILTLFGSSSAVAALIVNPAQPITHQVTVQPIIVSDNDNSNTATYFGDSTEQGIIKGFIDDIWAQAGIDVNFLQHNTWNNTFANWGTGGPTTTLGSGDRPTSDLSAVKSAGDAAGVTHANPNVINMFFVNIAAGFDLRSANSATGLAFRPGNGITQYVGRNLLTFTNGHEAIASVVAHEIGHNLGLPHLVEFENLLQTGSSSNQGERLNSDQINIALASNLSVTSVPLPAAFWLLGSGLIGLIGFGKSKKA